MKKATSILLVLVILTLALSLSACGKDGKDGITPTLEISEDGYWVINDTKTDVKAVGTNGIDGKDGKDGIDGTNGTNGTNGVTPTIEISGDGYWIINGTKTEYKAIGVDGTNGIDGVDGKPGEDGVDGTTPTIGISEDGYWIINGVKTDKKAIGVDGENGENGSNGVNGATIEKVEFDSEGQLVITLTNGTVLDPIELPKKEGHIHTFGEWMHYGDESVYCDKSLGYRICSECNVVEWKSGTEDDHVYVIVTTVPTCTNTGYDTKTCSVCGKVVVCNETEMIDHQYPNEYVGNNSFHWKNCSTCDNTAYNSEHTPGDDGACTVCNAIVGDTIGIAYDVSADGTYAEVIGYTGTATRIKIASEFNGLPVTNICSEAFRYTSVNITSIDIPNSVTSIGSYAFSNCSALTSITIPDSVTSIGYAAFAHCSSLASIIIPNSVTSIGASAFSGCSSLESITLPFVGTSVSETSASSLTLFGCIFGTSSYIGGAMTKQYYGFDDYSIYYIPSSLKSVSITGGNILKGAFYGCTGLTSIKISDGVTRIESSTFKDCSSLISITIPDSVNYVEYDAFENCNVALFTAYEYGLYVGNSNNPYLVMVGVTDKSQSTYTIHADTKVLISTHSAEAHKSLFYGCDRLTSITIPDGVTEISGFAFYGCKSLTNVTIPNSVTRIGCGAFASCTSLTSITLPDSVTSIGSQAFDGCKSLTSITIPDGVTSIDWNTFAYCNSLASIIIPTSLTSITNNSAFFDCQSLTSIKFEGTVEEWNAISKVSAGWNYYVPATEVVCSDGVVTL